MLKSDEVNAQVCEPVQWLDHNNKIDEPAFCEWFTARYKLIHMNGLFYDLHGEVKFATIEADVFAIISPYVTSGIAKKIKSLTEALKIYCHAEPLKPETRRIHVNNGYIEVDDNAGYAPVFVDKVVYCRNRLNVNYNPDIWNGVYYPERFLNFLYNLLESTDVITLQEFLGYSLVAETKGQVMMSIIGSGGEGKSRIGVVLQEIFKDNMVTGNYQRIENDRFFRYNLINKLLILDDDMQISALNSTGYIKTLITAEIPIDVEAKGKQSYQEYLYARILTFGNGSPKALYDHSDGFARRLIILTTKPKPKDRVDDPFISEKFIAEKEKIFCWMLDGLRRLIRNKFRFTLSEKTRNNVEEIMRSNCNVIDFLEDKNYIVFEPDARVSSKRLYEMYSSWCELNGLEALKRNTFIKWLNDSTSKYNIRYDTHIPDGTSFVRGYIGMKLNRLIK